MPKTVETYRTTGDARAEHVGESVARMARGRAR
jgi:hypothetical protein